MIKEAKDFLERVISERVPGIPLLRSVKEEKRRTMARDLPLITLVTEPGAFEGKEAKCLRYFDKEAGIYRQRFIRGNRLVPIQIRCWARGEEEADGILSRVMPAIPSHWEYDDLDGRIEIVGEEHSDHAGNMGDLYLSLVAAVFSGAAAMEAVDIPTIKHLTIEPGGIGTQGV
jgi:hypothetical protein